MVARGTRPGARRWAGVCARAGVAVAAWAVDDLDRALLDAWNRVLPRLRADPGERLRRLARRRRATLRRPPRAWCLALRASDTRLNHLTAYVEPLPPSADVDAFPAESAGDAIARRLPHTIDVDAPLIRRLTAPVRLPASGEDWQVVANLLGTHEETLRHAIRQGVLRARHVPRLGGKRGKPVPVLYSPHLLDPSNANHRTAPDPRWGTLWQSLADRLPADFTQTLTRVPRTRRDPRDDPDAPPRFRGWHWRCPACRKPVRTLFLPLPPATLQSLLGVDLHEDGRLVPHTPADIDPPPTTFACHHCHRVRYFDSQNAGGWNHLVTHLSGGLLYGSEVQMPEFY